jgi:hypothetical protein
LCVRGRMRHLVPLFHWVSLGPFLHVGLGRRRIGPHRCFPRLSEVLSRTNVLLDGAFLP